MGLDTIPDRTNGQTIIQSFFNLLKSVLKGDFVPRNTSGVVTSIAGSLGTSTYKWLNIFIDTTGKLYRGDYFAYFSTNGSIVTKSADYTITDSDHYDTILVPTGSVANVTITLPTAADNIGRKIKIQKVDTGTKLVEVAPEGAETLRGSTNSLFLCAVNETEEFISDGSNWLLLGDPVRRFSMRIDINGGAGIEYSSGLCYASFSRSAAGVAVITLPTGVFHAVPQAMAIAEDINTNAVIASAAVYGVTQTSLTVIIAENTADATLDSIVHIHWTGLK